MHGSSVRREKGKTMRDHSNHIDLTFEDAQQRMLDAARKAFGPRRFENVRIENSYERVLAEDVRARSESPSCLTCKMDSVALRWDDFESLTPNEIPDTTKWVRGEQWQFANTGIAMPEGFDTAIMIERAEVSADEQHIKLLARPSARYDGTRPAGSQVKKDEIMAKAGDVVTPWVAARIASGNIDVVKVAAKPRVAFIPTGNELIAPGVPPVSPERGRYAAYAKTFESNSALASGLIEQWGGVCVPFPIILDDRAQIESALRDACAMADIVVINAGSSKGSDDWTCEVLEELGDVVFHQVMHGPGRHTSFAIVDGTPVLGISGPPAGAALTLPLYLKPLVRMQLGADASHPTVKAVLANALESAKVPKSKPANWSAHEGFKKLLPVKVSASEAGTLMAETYPSMADPSAIASNAILVLSHDEGDAMPCAGDVIEVVMR